MKQLSQMNTAKTTAKTLSRLALGGAALSLLAACATKPDPAPVQEPVVQAPAPVAAPVERPIVQAPVEAPVIAAPDPNLPVPGTAADFAYQSGGEARVFFALNRYNLSPEARASLQSQANWLNTYSDYTAVIEGHADERGTREYNLALGERRADSVKAFLVSQGVSPSRLRTVSYGKERPIDPRSNDDGWSRNRNGFTNLNTSGRS